MTAHTPGPWRYVRENGSPTTGHHMIAGAKPGYLAEVRDCGSGDVATNARLIAAAPDLLEVLEEMTRLAIGPAGGVTQEAKRRVVAKALLAISKAKGEPA